MGIMGQSSPLLIALKIAMVNSFHYSRWDGTQEGFVIDEDQILEEISNDFLSSGDLHRALAKLMQRGFQSRSGERTRGLWDMISQLREQRNDLLEKYSFDSPFDEIKEKLRKIVQEERFGIDQRVQGARRQAVEAEGVISGSDMDSGQIQRLLAMLERRATRNLQRLDNLPNNPGGILRELSQYDFMNPEAQRQFQELLETLKAQMLQNYFHDIRDQLQSLTPKDIGGLQEMLGDLNQFMHDYTLGLQTNFQKFTEKHKNLFGSHLPENLDQLLENMAQQLAQMQSLLDSLNPDMRRELDDLLASLLDQETVRELSELSMALEQLYPWEYLRLDHQFLRSHAATLDQAVEMLRTLQGLDELESQIQYAAKQGNVDGLDLDNVENLLGENARRTVEGLQRLSSILEKSGSLRRNDDQLELTPRGVRKIGQNALREVFARLKKVHLGHHQIQVRGFSGEYSGETKTYEYGDPFDIDVQRSLMNALKREGISTPVRISIDDFEVRESTNNTQAATCVLLDQSRSMGLFGSFLAAKKAVLAMSALIHSKFPRDRFYVIGFSDYAIEIKDNELLEASWNAWVSGTNMHHALMMSRKLLSKEKVSNKQIILITDGEPTAHMEEGQAYFSYPPSYRTIEETLKEVKRCTQEGITINTFMLESNAFLLDFVGKMTKMNLGRAFYTTPDTLGEYVLVDYLSSKHKRVTKG
jgi:uncharacterized protein with von Willebrand factor type A (vWA) domain